MYESSFRVVHAIMIQPYWQAITSIAFETLFGILLTGSRHASVKPQHWTEKTLNHRGWVYSSTLYKVQYALNSCTEMVMHAKDNRIVQLMQEC